MGRPSTHPASVLIVDSSADEREMYAESFRHAGLDAVEADTVEDALGKAPDVTVVVTDMHLSQREDGLRLINHLRGAARTRNMLIVVLSASAMQPDRYRALGAGCDAFVAKPCRPSELLTVINYLVGIAPELREKRGL
jgi:two-component system cell cycle response regulator DivK